MRYMCNVASTGGSRSRDLHIIHERVWRTRPRSTGTYQLSQLTQYKHLRFAESANYCFNYEELKDFNFSTLILQLHAHVILFCTGSKYAPWHQHYLSSSSCSLCSSIAASNYSKSKSSLHPFTLAFNLDLGDSLLVEFENPKTPSTELVEPPTQPSDEQVNFSTSNFSKTLMFQLESRGAQRL